MARLLDLLAAAHAAKCAELVWSLRGVSPAAKREVLEALQARARELDPDAQVGAAAQAIGRILDLARSLEGR